MIFQVLRHELLHGGGLPFGLSGSGLSFNQLSFFWSSEFLLSVKLCLLSRKRRPLFLFLIVAGLIAATIWPSVTGLLLPRIQTIPAGGIWYYLNATADQLWPSYIDASSEHPVCFLPNATDYGVCPSGSYTSFLPEYLSELPLFGFPVRHWCRLCT